MASIYRPPFSCRLSGWFVLKNNLSLKLTTMDGQMYVLQQCRIVERVEELDNESSLKRARRRLTGKMVIKLPAPDWRFAVIKIKDFNKYFKRI